MKALFDIKPVDKTGGVDIAKIYSVQPVVNLARSQKPKTRNQGEEKFFFGTWDELIGVRDLALINQKPAKKAGNGESKLGTQSSNLTLKKSITNKETPEKGASFRSFMTRSLCSKTALTPELPSLYSRASDLSTDLYVDKSKAPVDPTGLAPVTSSVKVEYLLHNTTGPFPGLGKGYHEEVEKQTQKKPTKQNPVVELEKYLNSNLNIKKELRNIGGKAVVKGKMGKPRYRPIFISQKSGLPTPHQPDPLGRQNGGGIGAGQASQVGMINDFANPPDLRSQCPMDDYQAILSQINQRVLPDVDGFFGEPKKVDSFEYWDSRSLTTSQVDTTCDVRPSSEIESWARYARSAPNFQSVFKSRVSKPLLRMCKFFTNIRIHTFVPSRKFVVVVGVVGFSALIFTSFGQYGISVKNEISKESNLAVANLEQANDNLKVLNFEAASDNFAEAYEAFSKAGESLNFLGASVTSLFAESLDKFDELTAGKLGTSKFKSAKNLVEGGKLLAEAGQSMSEAVSLLSKTSSIFKLSTLPTSDVGHVDSFGALKKSLLASSKNLSKVNALLSEVSLEALPDDKRESFLEFRSRLPELESIVSDAIEHTAFLENLLSFNGTKKYLILFQNNSELRPTGGFPGTYAVATFKNGRLTDFLVDDVYNLDEQLKENIIPPKPLQHITPNWGMRDANWFIDFSVSAQKVMEFFNKEAGYEVDGVITVSPRIMSDILEAVGPIEMPEYDLSLDSENFLSAIQAEVEYGDNREQPKSVVVDIAPRLLEKIYSSDSTQWLEIFNAFISGLDRKDILMYFKDLNLEQFAAEKGFGGLIKDTRTLTDGERTYTGSDYLMVNLTNIKGSKTDRVTDNSIKLNSQFTTHNSQPAVKHKLTITRQHDGGKTKYGFYNKQNPAYVRVLVPESSELISIFGNSDPKFKPLIDYSGTDFKRDEHLSKLEDSFNFDSENGVSTYHESGKTGFAFWLITDPGEKKTVELEYAVPLDYAHGKLYDIYIQKQSGLEVSSFEFQAGGDYIYGGELDKDLKLRFKVE